VTITVRSCSHCPFFVQTALSMFAAFALAPNKLVGECDCPTSSGRRSHAFGATNAGEVKANRERKEKRMRVLDGERLPDACPLRASDVLVTLGS
jgi:hypothetical protein